MLIFTLEKHMVDEEAKLKRYVRVAEFRSEDGLGWPKDQKATTIQATSISFSSQCDFALVVLLFFLQRSLCRGSPAAKNMADDINNDATTSTCQTAWRSSSAAGIRRYCGYVAVVGSVFHCANPRFESKY